MKNFNGKAIYNPQGKAGEYAQWACNFYVGCSNGCEYCYCKKGILASVMGGNVPTLKKCFMDENHALYVFKNELKANLSELQKHGLFFTFTTDPFLPETAPLTISAINFCISNYVPVKILTKRADWDSLWNKYCMCVKRDVIRFVAFGFTLIGHDELEPNANTNAERIEAMRKLHAAGFKTWASIEPIIDFESSKEMITQTSEFCDLYKIGLESGKKYEKNQIIYFIAFVTKFLHEYGIKNKICFKDSLLKAAGINREDLPANCVGRDYNMFNPLKPE
ncbi:MAG: hypothetical protein FWD66_00975 [Paludibacter sp.]|nr:hypothetical protein [Paludibacter sp.]